jgi:uncharacterized membrane protein YcgQ (UPF0703/DUF1980 family)
MKKLLNIVVLLVLVNPLFAQTKMDMWNEFAKTKFEPKYYEKIGEYLFYPTFSAELKALVGKEVTLEGFYVPFAPEEGNYIILSKFPMSQCFFCGGGGPESISEVTFKDGSTQFQVDDFITIKGKLKLNTDDVEHVNFIITDAVIVKR